MPHQRILWLASSRKRSGRGIGLVNCRQTISLTRNPVITIGHFNATAEYFISRLQRHSISAVGDVRSAPFSRHFPQFNREGMDIFLRAQGIRYVFWGKGLGARPEDASCYENGKVQYARIARAAAFQEGLQRVLRGADSFRLALLCAEKDPLDCHRTLLVAQVLFEKGVEIQHILADGSLESHEEAMHRWLRLPGREQPDLYQTPEQNLAGARCAQEQNIAYVAPRSAAQV